MNPDTEFEKFRQFTQKVISVPKSEIDKREREYKKARKKRAKRRRLSLAVSSKPDRRRKAAHRYPPLRAE